MINSISFVSFILLFFFEKFFIIQELETCHRILNQILLKSQTQYIVHVSKPFEN